MANYSAITLQTEQNLIEISQRILCAPKALTQIEKRLGDRAFTELLNRYNRWIWKQINSLPLLDPDDAYSAALEGFQKAIATFDLTSGNALASWAYHCVRGALGTVLRKEQGQIARVKKLAATNTALVYEEELQDPYEQEQLHQSVKELQEATAQLSETARQIVAKRNEGMKFAAIGAELGKSADAVRMTYNRAITNLNRMLAQQPKVEVTWQEKPVNLQDNELTQQTSQTDWMRRSWERSKLNVRLKKQVPILSRTVRGISMTKRLRSTRAPLHRPRNTLFTKFLDSPVLKYISWLTVALLVLYRMLMGEWLVLLVCGVGGLVAALLLQHRRAISKHHQRQLLFGLCAVISWCFFTMHLPAHALFFDTLETGLTTLFARFGVANTTDFPLWVGALFRILGIVFLGILALRFGRSRDEDDEGTRQITGKVVQVIAALVIFDAMLELFTQ